VERLTVAKIIGHKLSEKTNIVNVCDNSTVGKMAPLGTLALLALLPFHSSWEFYKLKNVLGVVTKYLKISVIKG